MEIFTTVADASLQQLHTNNNTLYTTHHHADIYSRGQEASITCVFSFTPLCCLSTHCYWLTTMKAYKLPFVWFYDTTKSVSLSTMGRQPMKAFSVLDVLTNSQRPLPQPLHGFLLQYENHQKKKTRQNSWNTVTSDCDCLNMFEWKKEEWGSVDLVNVL